MRFGHTSSPSPRLRILPRQPDLFAMRILVANASEQEWKILLSPGLCWTPARRARLDWIADLSFLLGPGPLLEFWLAYLNVTSTSTWSDSCPRSREFRRTPGTWCASRPIPRR